MFPARYNGIIEFVQYGLSCCADKPFWLAKLKEQHNDRRDVWLPLIASKTPRFDGWVFAFYENAVEDLANGIITLTAGDWYIEVFNTDLPYPNIPTNLQCSCTGELMLVPYADNFDPTHTDYPPPCK